MRFEVDWQADDANAAAEERATVADLRIFVGEDNVCAYEQPRRRGKGHPNADRRTNVQHVDHVTISVYPLAEEIALNWWRLFGSRDGELRLLDGRGGYALPDVRLAFDGAGLAVRCLPAVYENPDVRFTHRGDSRVTRAQAESALTDFLQDVVARLTAAEVQDSGLQLRWRRVLASRQDAEESAFCEAAGALGLDPYHIADADADLIVDAGALFSGDPLAELLSGLSEPGNRVSGVLSWLHEAEGRPEKLSQLPGLHDLRETMADVRQFGQDEWPWAAGYRCARAVRRRLDIDWGERFDVSGLAERLEGPRFADAASVSGVRAIVETRAETTHVHLPTVKRYGEASRLFAFCRALGDAVANPPAERSVVNNLHNATRQATGRAFAAEFLTPIDEVLSMQDDGKNLHEIAEDFGVAKPVVERQLQNRQRIRTACEATGLY